MAQRWNARWEHQKRGIRYESYCAPARPVHAADFVTGDIRHILAFHDPLESLVIKTVELGLVQALSPFLDQRIEIVSLFEIEIKLAIIGIKGDKLSADRFEYLTQDRFHMGLQVLIRFITTSSAINGSNRKRRSRSSSAVAPMGHRCHQ